MEPALAATLGTAVETYVGSHPVEAAGLQLLRDQLHANENLQDRSNMRGHITGAGIVFNGAMTHVLLVHHKTFGRWLQPGGHFEPGDADPLRTAIREIGEETGLMRLRYVPLDPADPVVPCWLETHPIAASEKKGEAAHYHHDFRYCFTASDEPLQAQLNEVYDVAWTVLDRPEADEIRPCAQRCLGLLK